MGSTVNSTSAEIHSPTNQNFVYQGPTSAVFSYFFEPCLCFRFVVGVVFGSFPACVLNKPLKLNVTHTHTHVILFPVFDFCMPVRSVLFCFTVCVSFCFLRLLPRAVGLCGDAFLSRRDVSIIRLFCALLGPTVSLVVGVLSKCSKHVF